MWPADEQFVEWLSGYARSLGSLFLGALGSNRTRNSEIDAPCPHQAGREINDQPRTCSSKVSNDAVLSGIIWEVPKKYEEEDTNKTSNQNQNQNRKGIKQKNRWRKEKQLETRE